MISANTVFHFTNLKALASILKNGFYPAYSIEEYPMEDGSSSRLGIPMVSFCDIPLSQIAKHIKQYGRYGIGLSKTWAIKKGLNPVLYMEKSSFIWYKFESVLDQNALDIIYSRTQEFTNDSPLEVRRSLIYMFAHTKPYEGFQDRNGEKKRKRFYDEREWRHVPPDVTQNDLGPNELVLFEKELKELSDKIIEEKNTLLQKYILAFNPADIQYLIVAKESERPKMLKMLSKLRSQKYGEKETKILSSKIISAEQIKNDI